METASKVLSSKNNESKLENLSQNLIEKIRAKEKVSNEYNSVIKSQAIQSRDIIKKDLMRKMVDSIHYLFTQRAGSTIPYSELLRHLNEGIKSQILNENEISNMLEKIIQYSPEWIKIINCNIGKIIRISKTTNYLEVREKLSSLTF